MRQIIVLGGGLGGLFTGALLAHNGCQVHVLEMSHTLGGGLQTFVRHGLTCATGMHVIGGFQSGGSLHRICRYLGILDRLDIVPMPMDCMAQVVSLADGKEYRLPQGREAFTSCLVEHFPAEAEGIRRYVAAIFDIASRMELFNLRRPTSNTIFDTAATPVGSFLRQFTANDELLRVLAFLHTLYGGVPESTPAYIHALINVLYINGTAMFGSSSQQLADALREVIVSHGGEVSLGSPVTHIEVKDHEVQYVEVQCGERLQADAYVSSLHPLVMQQLCSEGAFPRVFVHRLGSLPHTYSVFKVYYELDAEQFPMLQAPVYLHDAPASFWHLQRFDEHWPQGADLFMSPVASHRSAPSASQQEATGHRMLMALCPMSFDAVSRWAESTTGHRPADYYQWKQQMTDRLTALISRLYPGFRSAIVSSFAASPLTFRDWTGSPQGSMYGFAHEADDVFRSQLSVSTRVRNLWLTGQNVSLHGICGVPLTAILTAEAVLGEELLEQI